MLKFRSDVSFIFFFSNTNYTSLYRVIGRLTSREKVSLLHQSITYAFANDVILPVDDHRCYQRLARSIVSVILRRTDVTRRLLNVQVDEFPAGMWIKVKMPAGGGPWTMYLSVDQLSRYIVTHGEKIEKKEIWRSRWQKREKSVIN